MIPIILKNFLCEIDQMDEKFYMGWEKAQNKVERLQDLKERAGMGLLDWEIYYQAAALN